MRKKSKIAKSQSHCSEEFEHRLNESSKKELARLKHELESRVDGHGAVDVITKVHNNKLTTVELEHEAFQRALKYWCSLVNQNYLDTCDSEADLTNECAER